MTKAEAIAAAVALKASAEAAFQAIQLDNLHNFETSYSAYEAALVAANALPDDVPPPPTYVNVKNLTGYDATVTYLEDDLATPIGTPVPVSQGGTFAVPIRRSFLIEVTPGGRPAASQVMQVSTTDFNVYTTPELGSSTVSFFIDTTAPAAGAVARFKVNGVGADGDTIIVVVDGVSLTMELNLTGGTTGGHQAFNSDDAHTLGEEINNGYIGTFSNPPGVATDDSGWVYMASLTTGAGSSIAITPSNTSDITDIQIWSPGRDAT